MFNMTNTPDIPEDLERVFLENLKRVMFNVDSDKDLNDFGEKFFNKHGHEIYEYHLKTFTKEELWRTIILSKSKEFIKMMKFQLDCQKYVGDLANSYMDELYGNEDELIKEFVNKRDKANDVWKNEVKNTY